MTDYPKISIVTPSFNQGKFLEKTILSVLEQDYPNLEYIIIDGGSTDDSVEIIKKYEKHLAYWVSEPDRGQSHAINKGFERATGDLLAWLNSDDYYAPGALKTVGEVYLANPDSGAIVGAGEMVDEGGDIILHIDPFDVNVESLYGWIDRFFWQPSCFFTIEAWRTCGPLCEDIHYAMDLDLWLKIAKKYSFAKTEKMLSTSLRHSTAKTTESGDLARMDAALVVMHHGGEKEAGKHLWKFGQDLAKANKQLVEYHQQLLEFSRQLAERDEQLAEQELRINALLNSFSWKMTAPVRWLCDRILPSAGRITKSKSVTNSTTYEPYHVRQLHSSHPQRPRIVHAIANFNTGGSSRLVIDLIEHLGHIYEQEVITSFLPNPPHYTGLNVREYKGFEAPFKIIEFLEHFRPFLMHVHYWGEHDKGWYEQVFHAAEKFGCKVVENINTPVEPFFSDSISQYVYVSDYVREKFGYRDEKSTTIYPGSNFDIFVRRNNLNIPDNCIGMVYRLEKDKLNSRSIDVFVKVVQRRPETKALIVGGGYYLEFYKEKARKAGVINSFTFTDYVSYQELPSLYEQMSIFVAPVWKESFGQVSPFAMNMGIPVVGYDIGALEEIIENGELLAPPGDSDRLADIIIGLLNDREKRLLIGEQNKKKASAIFSVEAMVAAYASLYSSLLG